MSIAKRKQDTKTGKNPKPKVVHGSRSNVEHTSESKRVTQNDLEKLSQNGFIEPASPQSAERDAHN